MSEIVGHLACPRTDCDGQVPVPAGGGDSECDTCGVFVHLMA